MIDQKDVFFNKVFSESDHNSLSTKQQISLSSIKKPKYESFKKPFRILKVIFSSSLGFFTNFHHKVYNQKITNYLVTNLAENIILYHIFLGFSAKLQKLTRKINF